VQCILSKYSEQLQKPLFITLDPFWVFTIKIHLYLKSFGAYLAFKQVQNLIYSLDEIEFLVFHLERATL